VQTLKQSLRWDQLPYPKTTKRLPVILSQEEVNVNFHYEKAVWRWEMAKESDGFFMTAF